MPRIPLVTRDEADPSTQVFFDVLQERFEKVPNLFGTVAQFPGAMKPLLEMFEAVYAQSGFSPRLTELVMVQVSFGLQSHYCLTMHKAFALEHDATIDEINALRDEDLSSFSESERVALEYAKQYCEDSLAVSDALFGRLSEHYSPSQIVNLTLLIGLSQLFGHTANALHIPIDSFVGAPPA